MGLPMTVDNMVSSTTTLGYGAPYGASSVVPMKRPLITYTAPPATTCMPSTTYSVAVPAVGSVDMAPYSSAYTTSPSAVPKYAATTTTACPIASMSVPRVYAAPPSVAYSSTTVAPATCASGTTDIRGGSVSVAPAVYTAASAPTTYASGTTEIFGGSVSVATAVYTGASAPTTYASGTTEIRGGSISVAPAVYTAASALPRVTHAARPVTTWGGGSLSLPPCGGSATMVAGGSVEVEPAVKYVGSSVSYPAAPTPMVTSTVAKPSAQNTCAVPTKVDRLVSAPVVTATRAAPVTLVAPPVTVATIPPVTTVTAPPVTTATVMEPLPTKVYIHRA